jgi:hypothetical protein
MESFINRRFRYNGLPMKEVGIMSRKPSSKATTEKVLKCVACGRYDICTMTNYIGHYHICANCKSKKLVLVQEQRKIDPLDLKREIVQVEEQELPDTSRLLSRSVQE